MQGFFSKKNVLSQPLFVKGSIMATREEEIKEAENLYKRLRNSCSKFCDAGEMNMIDKAYQLLREVSEKPDDAVLLPNVSHSLRIALAATDDIGLGSTSIVSALLHDVVTKTDISLPEIKADFGDTAANLIEEYSKLSNLNTKRIEVNSVRFRNLFMTIVDDIRVILLKLAHRLHDMRTILDLPEEKQEIFVSEIEHIYLPIAHRLGLYKVKTELEERLMQYKHPRVFEDISNKITETETKRKLFISEFIEPISRELIAQGFDFEVKGRPKSIHSIWEKMKRQGVMFEEVYDLFAIRIISNSKPKKEKTDCWRIYSIVTNIYTPNPKRLRDWISTPKASGYESLHTTVQGPNKKWVEVQIRSKRMDEDAEKGQAAHWRYKGSGSEDDAQSWLEQVRDIMENPDQLKFDQDQDKQKGLVPEKIFVFTPNGDLKELPRGSTILDFAYEIHTRVGDQCSGARVNNKIVPIRHELNNGDKVEIITSRNQEAKLDWLQFVITSKAKNKIKRSIKEQRYREAQEGVDILKRKLKNWKMRFSDEVIDKLVKYYKLSSSLDLYSMIAFEKADMNEIRKVLSDKEEPDKPKSPQAVPQQEKTSRQEDDNFLVIDDQLDHVNYKLAKCCNPIPGDEVYGFVTIGKGISIHRKSCPNAKRMLDKYGYRYIKVEWKESENGTSFQATIRIIGEDKVGMLGEITSVISGDLRVNMQSIKVDTKQGVFTGFIRLSVKDVSHLDEMIHKLLKLKGVTKVIRIDK